MLVTKAGEVRRGAQTEFYRSLVWLGRPANIASRLTDLANKSIATQVPVVREGHYYPSLDEMGWYEYDYDIFLDHLETTNSPALKHESDYFKTFFKSTKSYTTQYPPILITEAVWNGFKSESPDDASVKNNWWTEKSVNIKEYGGKVYGGDVIFTQVKDL